MAGRPRKSLRERCREGSFRAGAHHRLLGLEPDLAWPWLVELQGRYRLAGDEFERRALAVEFQRRLEGRSRSELGVGVVPRPALAELLAGLAAEEPERIRVFFERFLRHQSGPLAGEPFVLAPFQLEVVRELYRRDEAGRRLYQRALLGLPRGNGKTSLAAGLGLYELCARRDAPQVLFAGSSKEQAAIGIEFAHAFAAEGELGEWLRFRRRRISHPAVHGLAYSLGGDGRLHHGLIPTAAFVDELWAFQRWRELESYTALATSLFKRCGQAYLLSTTTAGPARRGRLWTIRAGLLARPALERPNPFLTVLRDTDAGFLFWWYGAPEEAAIDDEEALRGANPAPWLDLELLRRSSQPDLSDREYRRLILNQWPIPPRR